MRQAASRKRNSRPGKRRAGEGVTGQRASDKLTQSYSKRDLHAIEEKLNKGHTRFEGRNVILDAELRRQPLRRQLEALRVVGRSEVENIQNRGIMTRIAAIVKRPNDTISLSLIGFLPLRRMFTVCL